MAGHTGSYCGLMLATLKKAEAGLPAAVLMPVWWLCKVPLGKKGCCRLSQELPVLGLSPAFTVSHLLCTE